MNILKKVKELQGLIEEATPGPFEVLDCMEGMTEKDKATSLLATETLNALPEILEFCKEAMGIIQSMTLPEKISDGLRLDRFFKKFGGGE